ncbi:MAG: hypothetical protein PHE20_03430 [Patescibacteria group bacterium]|nr:hypothetical protein [Patescibacteria group bacterium]
MDSYNKIHLVAADMGYGHQRAIYPLIEHSLDGPINLNDYLEIEDWEKKYWLNSKRAYEKISYFKKVPLLGDFVFKAMDYFQRIEKFYPNRNLEKQSLQQKLFFKEVKRGVGKKLIERLNKNPIPLVTSFFVAAYAAEYYKYKGDIYCIVCDADISRAWAPISPETSRVKYLAPNNRVKDRLMMYGVKESNIIITGFPLPLENISGDNNELVNSVVKRLRTLDPNKIIDKGILSTKVEEHNFINQSKKPTITFAVGGAGAQREIAALIAEKLKKDIENGKIKLNLVAGSRLDVYNYFEQVLEKLNLRNNPNITIVYHPQKMEYFRLFNLCLVDTDILWTKPSELSFYAGLGLPIIISDPVGSQEVFNREWLLTIGAGLDSLDPMYVDEWIYDWIDDGRLAKASLNAYLYAEHNGTQNIYEEIFKNN